MQRSTSLLHWLVYQAFEKETWKKQTTIREATTPWFPLKKPSRPWKKAWHHCQCEGSSDLEGKELRMEICTPSWSLTLFTEFTKNDQLKRNHRHSWWFLCSNRLLPLRTCAEHERLPIILITNSLSIFPLAKGRLRCTLLGLAPKISKPTSTSSTTYRYWKEPDRMYGPVTKSICKSPSSSAVYRPSDSPMNRNSIYVGSIWTCIPRLEKRPEARPLDSL